MKVIVPSALLSLGSFAGRALVTYEEAQAGRS